MHSLRIFGIAVLLFISEHHLAGADNVSTPISFFNSRPDLLAPAMTVTLSSVTSLTPGFVFITPYQEEGAGPYIFDKLGNLVYAGFGEIGPYNAHNLHVCSYQGSDHLCTFLGNQLLGYARGHAVILNTDYEIVKTFESGLDTAAADQHEFRLIDNGTSAVLTIYSQIQFDLSPINITDVQGWLMQGMFQEINGTDGSVIFSWNSIDHVEPWDSYVYPGNSDIAGDGRSAQSPWDYFHINSVFKSDFTGNYLISARHMSTIYNINASDGSIIWRLQAGGKSDFACNGFNFSFQHDAEIRSENETTMIISIYDNASNGYNSTASASSGKVIALRYDSMTATLVGPMTCYPGFTLQSSSQGNTQLLESGNWFHGWGSWPMMSEHTGDGEAIWSAQLGPDQGRVMSYRAFSSNWSAVPSNTKPALWTFSKDSDGMVALYVSWNGCTEVESWTFYGRNAATDAWTRVGSTTKNGFETTYTSETHYTYTMAEAVGSDGLGLRNSTSETTFVPSSELSTACSDLSCPLVVRSEPSQMASSSLESRANDGGKQVHYSRYITVYGIGIAAYTLYGLVQR